MSDIISQYDDRTGDHGIGWGAAIVLSAGFHIAAFISFYWLLPILAAMLLLRTLVGTHKIDIDGKAHRRKIFGLINPLTASRFFYALLLVIMFILPFLMADDDEQPQEKEEVVVVKLLETVPPPPAEEATPKKFVQEPLASPPPPQEDVLNEVLPVEDKTSSPPPEIVKTEARPPKVAPPEVEAPKPKPAAPRPKPPQGAGPKDNGPKPMSGLSESAASRLLGQSLGYGPGQVVASSGGTRPDEELARYVEIIKSKIRSAWAPAGRAMAAKQPAHFEIYIEPGGKVSRARMTKTSGNRDFDQSVERALKKASPFPPLPSAFGGQAAILDLSLSPEQMR